MGSNYFLLNVDNGDLFKVGKFFDNTKTKSIGFDKMDRGLPDHFVSATIDALSFFLASSVGCRLTTISFSELEKYLHLAFVEWMKENPTDSDGVAHWSVIGDPVSMAKLYQTRRYNNYKNNAKPLPPKLVGAELKSSNIVA